MGEKKLKRKRSARCRTLPPDAKSLCEMVRALTRRVQKRGAHLKAEHHDYWNRRGFRVLYEDRAKAFQALIELDEQAALSLRQELGLRLGGE